MKEYGNFPFNFAGFCSKKFVLDLFVQGDDLAISFFL
jgi:hypothetical protein